jgi:hypothetical protein
VASGKYIYLFLIERNENAMELSTTMKNAGVMSVKRSELNFPCDVERIVFTDVTPPRA